MTKIVKKSALGVAGDLAVPIGLGWLGLQIRPASFPAVSAEVAELEMVPLPEPLPAT